VFGIYDRSGNVISSGPISDLVGETGFLSDPQIFWDPATSRFYYAIFENRDSTSTGPDEGIAWGFSKDGTPDNTSDWCNYFNEFTYGTTSYPDYPRLGDSADFLLIGTNRFDLTDQYISSDLAWISKPSAGTTCPAASSFQTGIKSNLKNPDGSQVFTPVPARQIDSKSTGWVVGTPPASLNPNYLTIYRVTRSPATGAAVIGAPKTLPVAAYSVPPDAPQGGVTTSGDPAPPLNTLSGKLTQAFSGTDPRFSHTEIWTAHTVAGGAGSVVRWYEIDPNGLNLDQSGTVASKSLYVFNGTVAPDRLVRGAKAKFGRNLVVGFNTSSQSTFSGIRMVSKLGSNPQSSKVLLKQSSGPNLDSTCFNPNRYGCRWGDYSGASPDPGAALTATSGRVWLSNQWNLASIDDSSVDWRTLNWSATP
jgi:hypothetical protein